MGKKIWTVAEAISRVQEEMDTNAEVFIDENEYIIYINDGVDEAEAEIHKLNEDYMLTSTTLDMVNGQSQYALPLNIYANKIKLVQFKRNSFDFYKIRRAHLRDIAALQEVVDRDPYFYIIRNDGTAEGVEIEFFPTPGVTESGIITLWYLRNAERVSATTDLIDIPEFASFVFAYMKYRIAVKEMSPLIDQYTAELDHQRNLMRTTLDQMIVDPDETLPMDTSFYDDIQDPLDY